MLWALLALPWVAGLLLARRHHLDAGSWAVVLTVSLGLPTLWVTWATFRDARRAGAAESGPGLPRIADELAAAVGRQWAREAAMRRLNDPYPLPVSWAAAAADLAAPWESLGQLAASGAGWPPPVPGRVWAAGPGELAGENGELTGVLAKVPTGRLVVLGEPGSGKTMLMVRLVLDLLASRVAGGPVPVLVPVASWDPSGQGLRDWLATRLITDYPALAGPPPAGAAGPTRATALLEGGLILLVLDGLDEIPESARVRGGQPDQRRPAARRAGAGDLPDPSSTGTRSVRLTAPRRSWRAPQPSNCARLMPVRPAATCVTTRPARPPGPAGTLCWRCSARRPRPRPGRH